MRAVRFLAALAVVSVAVSGCVTSGSASPTATRPSPTGSTVTVSDNGIAALSAPQIARRAVQAFDESSAVHVKGFVSDNDQKVTFDVVAQGATDGTGTVTGDGETVKVIQIGGEDYAKASLRFWATFGPDPLGKSAVGRTDGKYVKASHRSVKLGMLTKFLDISRTVRAELAEKPNVTKGGRQVIDGVSTIAITSSELGTVYVATQGQPYVIRVVPTGGQSEGVWDFSGYLAPVDIQAPAAGQTVDFASLQGSGH